MTGIEKRKFRLYRRNKKHPKCETLVHRNYYDFKAEQIKEVVTECLYVADPKKYFDEIDTKKPQLLDVIEIVDPGESVFDVEDIYLLTETGWKCLTHDQVS